MANSASKSAKPRIRVPRDFSSEERAELRDIIRELADGGLFNPTHRGLILLYARVAAAWKRASAAVAKDGIVFTYKNGLVGPSPDYRAMVQLGGQLRAIISDLRLSPKGQAEASPVNLAAPELDLD